MITLSKGYKEKLSVKEDRGDCHNYIPNSRERVGGM